MATNQQRIPPQRQESNTSLTMSETSGLLSAQFGQMSAFDSGSSYVTDDESFNTSFDVSSQTSFGLSQGQKIDDKSLALLIGKLKGSLIGDEENVQLAKDDAESVGSCSTPGDMEDDVIANHLKALANCTTRGPQVRIPRRKIDDEEESIASCDDDDEGESDDEEEEEDELDDETVMGGTESVDETDYAAVDEMIKKLGVQVNDGGSSLEDHRQHLESIALQSQTYDFEEAPTTTSSKKLWLSQLACELLDEDSSSDEETVATVNVNISSLARVAESAEKIISASQKQQAKMTNWRAQQRSKQVSFTPESNIELDVYYEGMKSGPLARGPNSPSVESKGNEHVSRDHSNDVDSVFTPVDKLVPGDNYGMPWAFALDSPAEKPLEVVIPQSTSKRKHPRKKIPVSQKAAPGTTSSSRKAGILQRERLPPRPAPGPKKRGPPRTVLPSVDEAANANEPAEKAPSDSQQENSKERASSKTVKADEKVTIPPGYPPYPGFGQKWPWHPYSSDAPAGYRECYMHHMGEQYFQYMEFLRNKGDGPNEDDKQAEEIFRHSLTSEGKFKSKKSKPKPALSPYTFTSNPGKARKNCVVPVAMPKIEEGSNSSGSTNRGRKNTRKKVVQRETKPVDVRVGKHHPKSKGRKGKIVVRSGAELKQEAKRVRKEPKVAKKPAVTKAVRPSSAHSRSILSQEQPVQNVADQQCACTIM